MAEEAKFQQLKQEHSQIMQKIAEIDSERNQHTLVLDALNKQLPDKKCWRLLGGVLIEKTVSDIAPSLSQNIGQMDQIIETLTEQLQSHEKQLTELHGALGKKIGSGQQSQAARQSDGQSASTGGVLV